jgi:hypothetical protein
MTRTNTKTPPAGKKPGAEKPSVSLPPEETVDVEALQETVASLKEEIKALREQVSPADKETKTVSGNRLDFSRPYTSHRSVSGISLEQDGKIFNLKGNFVRKVRKPRG